MYTSRSSAIKQGFTHEALFFGIRHWMRELDDGTPHLIPVFVPCGWFAQLGAFMHYVANELSGANLDFEIAKRPIDPAARLVAATRGELA